MAQLPPSQLWRHGDGWSRQQQEEEQQQQQEQEQQQQEQEQQRHQQQQDVWSWRHHYHYETDPSAKWASTRRRPDSSPVPAGSASRSRGESWPQEGKRAQEGRKAQDEKKKKDAPLRHGLSLSLDHTWDETIWNRMTTTTHPIQEQQQERQRQQLQQQQLRQQQQIDENAAVAADEQIPPYKHPPPEHPPPETPHSTRASSSPSQQEGHPGRYAHHHLHGGEAGVLVENDDLPQTDTRTSHPAFTPQSQMSPWPESGPPYRFGWQQPLLLSPPSPSAPQPQSRPQSQPQPQPQPQLQPQPYPPPQPLPQSQPQSYPPPQSQPQPYPPPPPPPALLPQTTQLAQRLPKHPNQARIAALQEEIWTLRSQIHELRASLRDKQTIKSRADDALMQRFLAREMLPAELIAPLEEAKSMTELRKDCQVARDEYGPLEDDCNQLEDRLSRQEFDLTNLERRADEVVTFLPPPLQQPPPLSMQHPPSAAPSISNSASSSDDDDDDDEDHHPLVKRYLSLLGDLDILHERLDDLTDERQALQEQLESRQRFHLALDADDQAWLDSAPGAHAELVAELHATQATVDTLHRECLEQGLIDEEGEPTDFATQERWALRGDVDAKGEVSDYVRYAHILPQPNLRHHDADVKLQQSALVAARLPSAPPTASIPPALRTNQWLFQRLCTSALEVNLLASTFELSVGAITDGWQLAVLALWFRDSTMRHVLDVRRFDQLSMKTQAPLRIDVDDGEDLDGTLEEDDDDESDEDDADDDDDDDDEQSGVDDQSMDADLIPGRTDPNDLPPVVLSPSYKLPSNRSIALEGSDGGVMVSAGPLWGIEGAQIAASC